MNVPMTKEEHEADIAKRKAANLERAKAHFAGREYADPRPPSAKLVHRLTTTPRPEDNFAKSSMTEHGADVPPPLPTKKGQ